MEKNVAIPIEIYKESQKVARNLGMTMTDFLTTALHAYVAKHQNENVTDKLNQIYQTESSTIDPLVMKMQVLSLGAEPW